MKQREELPQTYHHTNDLGFTETSTVFPVLPDVEEPTLGKVSKSTKKIWVMFCLILTTILGFVTWIVLHHKEWRSFYDTYQQSLHLPKLPKLPKLPLMINDDK
jgi:hypothetical protein